MTLPAKDVVIAALGAPDQRPVLAHDLAAKMGVAPGDLSKFLRLLRSLERGGLIINTKDGRLTVPSRAGLISGTLSMSPRGYGMVASGSQKYYVAPDDLEGAIHLDTVLIKPGKNADGANWGRVIKVVARGLTTLTGVYRQHHGYGEVKADEPRVTFTVFVSSGDAGLAGDGDRVAVKITRYPESGKDARARVTEVIGQAGEPLVDARAIALRFGFLTSFSEDTLVETAAIPQVVPPDGARGRLDLRQNLVVTIDGEDAKDFDDAVSVEPTGAGWRLGVHIADVSAYVLPGTRLDASAYDRATSVYLHGLTLPMLPAALSNGACSLNPSEDRLTISVFLDLDSLGRPGAPTIARSIIKSRARLTYEAVNSLFDTGRVPSEWPQDVSREMTRMLGEMREPAALLRSKRMERGSLDFDFPEYRVRLDAQGRPLDIHQSRRGEAEKLIEEFMIAANEAVAGHLFHLSVPCMYRVHERPDKQDLDELNEILAPLGYRVKGTNNLHPRAIQALLEEVRGKPEESMVSDVVLRSLKKARYSPVWLGHFGLSSPLYCHFTSPIRRYPDLMVHRALDAVLDGTWHGSRYGSVRALLDEAADHCSEREMAAQAAERASLENMKLLYVASKVGDIFPGVIKEVVPFGLFVEMDNGVTGLVHISALGAERFEYNERSKTISGRRAGAQFRTGQRVTVQVLRADMATRRVELTVVRE